LKLVITYPDVPDLFINLPDDVADPVSDIATDMTVAAMAAVVNSCRGSKWIKQLAERFRLGDFNQIGFELVRLRALYDWLSAGMVYYNDPPEQELLRHPDELADSIIRQGRCFGDCDDRAMLAAALMQELQIPAVFVVVDNNGRRAARWAHVYPASYGATLRPEHQGGPVYAGHTVDLARAKLIALDSQEGYFNEHPPHSRARVWRVA
jgi:hypothetical protein